MKNVPLVLAHQLENRKIRVVRHIAPGLGMSTLQLYQIDGNFYDASPIVDMVYDSGKGEVALAFPPAPDGLPLTEDFYRDVLAPLRDLVIQTNGDLCADVFNPICRAMKRLRKLY